MNLACYSEIWFCHLFCMGVILGLSYWGRNIGWRCSRTGYWRIQGRRLQNWQLYILNSSRNIIWLIKSRRMIRAARHFVWGTWEVHIGFWEGTLRERDHLEYQGEGGEIFRTYPDLPWGPPNLLYNWYRVFPGGKERPGRDIDPSPLLVPWSRKSRAIPLLPLWTVRPVQRLSACTRVHFTFTFIFTLTTLPVYSFSFVFTLSFFKFGSSCDIS